MDCMGINQRVREFDNAHGSFVCIEGWILFEDGARREKNPLGALISPPTDPQKRAKNIVQYHQCRLDLAVKEFSHFKKNHLLNIQAALREEYAPAPIDTPESVIRELKSLQSKVKERKKALKKAESQLEKYKPNRLREVEERSNKNRALNQELFEQISDIEI